MVRSEAIPLQTAGILSIFLFSDLPGSVFVIQGGKNL
jgi:hypothetical protein